jgi:hypothetical protein
MLARHYALEFSYTRECFWRSSVARRKSEIEFYKRIRANSSERRVLNGNLFLKLGFGGMNSTTQMRMNRLKDQTQTLQMAIFLQMKKLN